MKYATGWVAGFTALLLAGCVTSSPSPSQFGKTSPKLAAQYNTQLAIAYMQQGRMDLARSKLADALRQAPKTPEVHNALALYYERTGRPHQAAHQYQLSLDYDPGNPDTQNNYGAFLCREGKYRESIDYFVKASNNLNYDTPDKALANAGLCALRIPDKTLAEKYFKQALAINPNQGQSLWNLGLMSFEAGKYTDANAYLARLIDITQRPSPTMLWVAIEAAWAGGNRTRAEYYGRELLKLYPNSVEAQKFVKLVGTGS